ncbi:hypothetical protein RUND412_009307 [Rhizina undulata]
MLSLESPKLFLPASQQAPAVIAPRPGKNEVAQKYITSILELYAGLSKIEKLDPSPEVNSLFGKLVSICAQIPDEAVTNRILTDPNVVKITAHLRQLCSDGECRLELYWADRVTSQTDANKALLDFPYYNNYVDLTRMELNAIRSVTDSPRSFAFIGSGPLPLTSLCLADILDKDPAATPKTPIVIHNIDRDARAIDLSTKLAKALGSRARSLTFQCTEAKDGKGDLKDFDVVYLAALVGSTVKQKDEIIKDVVERMRDGALLVLRSAHSLRGLLYPVVNAATDVKNSNLEPLLVVHPYNRIINSVVIAKVRKAEK